MPRKRMIDPEFYLDEELAKISTRARLFYIGCWMLADDNVFTLPNRPEWLKAQLFPYERVDIQKLIQELINIKKLIFFSNDGKNYLFVKNMGKYQRIEKPSKQKYPAHDEKLSKLECSRGVVGEQSGNTPAKEKLNEVKLREVKRSEVNDMVKDFSQQKQVLLASLPTNLLYLFNEYLEIAKNENKTGQITPSKEIRLITELINIYNSVTEKEIFEKALLITCTNEAPNPNYIRKVIKSIQKKDKILCKFASIEEYQYFRKAQLESQREMEKTKRLFTDLSS